MTLVLLLLVTAVAMAIGFTVGRVFERAHVARPMLAACEGATSATDDAPPAPSAIDVYAAPPPSAAWVTFSAAPPRETRSTELEAQSPAWRDAMRAVGATLDEAGVRGVVFAHGTFTGTDPLSALAAVEREGGGAGRALARELRKRTRAALDKALGDAGNFTDAYVRLFEAAVGAGAATGALPCTSFVWSSENHHVGRVEGALGLVRVLARHAELHGQDRSDARLLAFGHSHAGQLFALVTQLMSGSVSAEAIMDVARARGLDVAALRDDLAILEAMRLDLVTLGAPARYAWAAAPNVRALHVSAGRETRRGELRRSDWIQRLGERRSDFPALDARTRRLNESLDPVLDGATAQAWGSTVLVDYGAHGPAAWLATGLGHAVYTRADAMAFHAALAADMLYARPPRPPWNSPPTSV
jgi:hypothetical protein